MEAIVERACGLDVHQATVVACALVGRANERPRKEIRSFGTMTKDLLALRDWLEGLGCTHVAMESTGVYWKPIYAVLEGDFELIVGNAHHIKAVPGRKTDVKDSEWIAELLRVGLIAKSFVPPKPLRQLRDLLRYRRKLVESRSAERCRLLKLLETANIKLATVASDVFGKSTVAMLRALLRGDSSPQQMAQLAKGRLRRKLAELELALEGRLEEHHRFILQFQLDRLEAVEADVASLDQRITERMEPYASERELLEGIPGIDTQLASVLIAEMGTNMNVFGSPERAAAWAGVCPGNNESAGKRKHASHRRGNVHLKTALVEAAHSIAHTKGNYLRDKFFKIKARRGYHRAAMAIAHKLLIAAYHMLLTRCCYRDLGESYLDRLAEKRVKTQLVKRLNRLGYEVHLTATAS